MFMIHAITLRVVEQRRYGATRHAPAIVDDAPLMPPHAPFAYDNAIFATLMAYARYITMPPLRLAAAATSLSYRHFR